MLGDRVAEVGAGEGVTGGQLNHGDAPVEVEAEGDLAQKEQR